MKQFVCVGSAATSGGLAQLVERVLSMHEVSGSIPEFSILHHSGRLQS